MRIPCPVAAAAVLAAPAAAQTPPRRPVDYAKPANWLCLPGRADTCSTPLATTALNPNGYGSTGPSTVASNPQDRLLHRLSDGQPRRRPEQRPRPRRRRGKGRRSPASSRASRRVPHLRADLSLDDARRGHRRRRPAATSPSPPRSPSATSARRGATISPPATRAARSSSIGHSQGSLMLQQLLAREIEGRPEAQADEARHHPRLQRHGAAGQARRRHLQVDPAVRRPGETGCVMSWVSFRERNAPPAGAMFGIATSAGHDRRLHQSGAPRRDRLGAARQLLERALDARPSPAARSPGRPKAPRRRPTCAPKAWSRRAASTTARAAICRSAPTPTPPTSAPTASAAKSARSASSSPAGECT